jgi:DnaK suppressor protein
MLVQSDTAAPTRGRANSAARAESVRTALLERQQELQAEHAEAVAELVVGGAVDSGDDIADLGTKAFIREQELTLVTAIRGRIEQVEHALTRLDQGSYGTCESCGQDIPVARLAAFPAVTQCVGCKAADERR